MVVVIRCVISFKAIFFESVVELRETSCAPFSTRSRAVCRQRLCQQESHRFDSQVYLVNLVKFEAFAPQDVEMDAGEEISTPTSISVHFYRFSHGSWVSEASHNRVGKIDGESCLEWLSRWGDVDFRQSRLPYPQTRQARDQLPRWIFSGPVSATIWNCFPVLPSPSASRSVVDKVQYRTAVKLAGETICCDSANFSVSVLCSEISLWPSLHIFFVGVHSNSIVHDEIQLKSPIVVHNSDHFLHTSFQDV